jgi:ABC-type transport system involved in multi-copper enzyme maturation permease subunit
LRESLRRKMFLVVLLLTVAFLALFWVGTWQLFKDLSGIQPPDGIDARTLAGSTVFGLSMFATLFLGTVLAVFLTLSAVRGDAERGLLQPLVVRPVGRATFLLSRFLCAALVCSAYVLLVYAAAMLIVGRQGHWWPDRIVAPGLELALGVAIVAALSLLGSVFLSATANGVAIFMLFGAGLVAGLLGQIGEALNSHTLKTVGRDSSWALPFEALYQDGLHRITADTAGFTRFALELGPFGGAQIGGAWLFPWVGVYLALLGAAALAAFARRDL